jgi:hypothetical protein
MVGLSPWLATLPDEIDGADHADGDDGDDAATG